MNLLSTKNVKSKVLFETGLFISSKAKSLLMFHIVIFTSNTNIMNTKLNFKQKLATVLIALFALTCGQKTSAQSISSPCDGTTIIKKASPTSLTDSGVLDFSATCGGGSVGYNYTISGPFRANASFGCSGLDPVMWIDGGTIVVNFATPVNNVGFYVWGIDSNDRVCFTADGSSNVTLTLPLQCGCPGQPLVNLPVVDGSCVKSGGFSSFTQSLISINAAAPFTQMVLTVTGGSGFGFVGLAADPSNCPVPPCAAGEDAPKF